MERNNGSLGAAKKGSDRAPQVVQTVLNFTLPSGIKRKQTMAGIAPRSDDEEDSEESADEESSFDEDYVPPPRTRGPGARGAEGGLRAEPQVAGPRYWDHENHAAACAAEAQELANGGVSWEDIDASEGDSDCDVESEGSEDESGEDEESEDDSDAMERDGRCAPKPKMQ